MRNIIFVLCAMFAMLSPSFAEPTAFTSEYTENIEKVVHDYIEKNPQVVINALIKFKQQEMSKRELQTQTAIKDNARQIFGFDQGTTYGNEDATIKIVEFMDYRCKHCKNMASTLNEVLDKNHDVQIVVKQLPIFGGPSLFAAKAALAAANQNKFQDLHKALMQFNGELTDEKVLDIARSVELDIKTLKKDINSQNVEEFIKSNFELSQKLRIMGTPAFIVGKENSDQVFFIPGAVEAEQLLKLVDKVTG